MSARPVILTRPRHDSEKLACKLAGRGIVAIVAPVIDIAPVPSPRLPAGPFQAVLITSANAVRALEAAGLVGRLRALTAICVGPSSGEQCRQAGFADVAVAGGDVESLLDLVRRRLDAGAGALFYPSGERVSADLAALLGEFGFTVERTVVYTAHPVDRLPAPARRALTGKAGAAVALYSRRTAHIWCDLVAREDLADAAGKLRYICLSAQVAGEVAARWGKGSDIVIAAKPLPDVMFETIATHC